MSYARRNYDKVPYQGKPFLETHPERLAAQARLFGLNPPAADKARILELGCAQGYNLIPMAATMPESQFLGIDLSNRHISEGLELVKKLGLKNIELRVAGISDIGAEIGKFDYILCQGVFSWVPLDIQEKILQICQDQLNDEGLVFLSYNTMPGWYFRGLVKDILVYHSEQFEDPTEQCQQARAMIDYIAKNAVNEANSSYGGSLRGASEMLQQTPDWYMLDEYLAEFNQPLYFHEFVALTAEFNLRHVCDTYIQVVPAGGVPPDILAKLERDVQDRVRREQYLDYLTRRSFRRSLLCKGNKQTADVPNADALKTMYLGVMPHTAAAASADSTLQAAWSFLVSRWPEAVHWPVMIDGIRAQVGTLSPEAESALANQLLQAYLTGGFPEPHTVPTIARRIPGYKPKASPLVRVQAEKEKVVCSLRHGQVELDEVDRHLVRQLDGTKDRKTLLESLKASGLPLDPGPEPMGEISLTPPGPDQVVEYRLRGLAEKCLLVG